MMTRIVYCVILVLCFGASTANAQDGKDIKNEVKKMYTTSGGELIFSWANAQLNGADVSTITRFSPVFNFQLLVHRDIDQKLGFFTGLNMRNVGFIYDDPFDKTIRKKARSYTLGIPLAIKIGNLTGLHIFGGYELELPFNFKEKTFVNGEKTDKSSTWFSKRTPAVYHSLFVGVQTRYGVQVKFKYYLTNFFNKSYTTTDDQGQLVYPYSLFDAHVFYISLSYQILKGDSFYYTSK